jgi:hypothetical protein
MTITTHDPDAAPEPVSEPLPESTPESQRPRGTYERPSVVLTRGRIDLDPLPTPINLRTIRTLARKTWRNERKNYARSGRERRLTSGRLAASILPNLDRAVFVVGAARSGTTFLGDCVGHLPEISYHFEPPATKAAGRYVAEGRWGYRRSRWFFRTVYAWLMRVELEGGLRFSEKTPTNALIIPFLARAFRDSQFIHIVRDGRDAAASHIDQPWLRRDSLGTGRREPGGYLYGPHPQWWVDTERHAEFEATTDVHRMAWAWRAYVDAALRDGRALPPERYLELRYEEMVTHPAATADTVLDFLGITAESSRRLFTTALERADSRSVGAWRRRFSDEEISEVEAEIGPVLRDLGYE